MSTQTWSEWAWSKLTSYQTSPYVDWLTVLTPEQFSYCFHFLDFESLIVCSKVCKKWKSIANSEELWNILLTITYPFLMKKYRAMYKNSYTSSKQIFAICYVSEYYTRPIKPAPEPIYAPLVAALKLPFYRRFNQTLKMFHPSNGRDNFLPFTPSVPFSEMPDKETLIKILSKENELRLSKEIQKEYWLTQDCFEITLRVQTQAVQSQGFNDPWIIPSALSYYQDDPEITSIPHYVRFNRSKQGKLECGDSVPDIPLSTLQGCATSMHSLLSPYSPSHPVLIAAGSYT